MQLSDEKDINTKLLKKTAIVELIIVVVVYLITMTTTYLVDGVEGVEKTIMTLIEQFGAAGLIATAVNCFIGILFWILYRYFNFTIQLIFKEASEGLIDTSIALFRLSGGILIAFSIIYFVEVRYEHILIIFVIYGLISIFNTTFLVFFKMKLYQKPERPLRRMPY